MSSESEFEHTGRVIRDEIRIETSPEVVYRAWADPEWITAWFVGQMDGAMTPGETVVWRWDSTGDGMSQEVIIADAPHRLVTAMQLPDGVSYLEVTVEQDGGHSIVRLIQSGFGEGPEWDDQYDGMLSGWMMALGVLKLFAERYAGRSRREVLVLRDAAYGRDQIVELHRSRSGLSKWLTRSGEPGGGIGEPVQLVLSNGSTLSGRVLRNTPSETLWSWDEIEGAIEIKAYQGAHWGSKVGVRVTSWLQDAAALADVEGWLGDAVDRLVGVLSGGTDS